MDAVGATIRDDEAKADLKQAVSAVGEALGATFDEAALALRGVIGSKGDEDAAPSATSRRRRSRLDAGERLSLGAAGR